MSVKVSYSLTKKDLECCICYDVIYNLPLIQCSTGNHFVCRKCRVKTNGDCPICCTSPLLENKLLSKNIKKHTIKCPNVGCNEQIIHWGKSIHQEHCTYVKSSCFLCNIQVDMAYLSDHLKTDCDSLWTSYCVENSELNDSWDCNGERVNLSIVSDKNCVVFLKDSVIMVRTASDRAIGVINLDQNAHVLIKECANDMSFQTSFHIQPFDSLKQLNEATLLPILPSYGNSFQLVSMLARGSRQILGMLYNIFFPCLIS